MANQSPEELKAALFLLDVKTLVDNMDPPADATLLALIQTQDVSQIVTQLAKVPGYKTLKTEVKDLDDFKAFDPAKVQSVIAKLQTITATNDFQSLQRPFYVGSSCDPTNNPATLDQNPATVTVNVRSDPQNATEMTFRRLWRTEAEREQFCENVETMKTSGVVAPFFVPFTSCEIATKYVKFSDYQNDMAQALQDSIKQAFPVLKGRPSAQEVLYKLKDAIAECTATKQEIEALEKKLAANKAAYGTSQTLAKKISILKALVNKNQVPLANLVAQVDRMRLAAPNNTALEAQTTLNAMASIAKAQSTLTSYGTMAANMGPQTINITLTQEEFERALLEVQAVSALPKSSVISINNSCFRVEPRSANGFLTLTLEPCVRNARVRKVDLPSVLGHVKAARESLVDDWHARIMAISHTQQDEKSVGVFYVALVEAKHVRASDVPLGPVDADGYVSVNRRLIDSNASIKVEIPDYVFVLQVSS